MRGVGESLKRLICLNFQKLLCDLRVSVVNLIGPANVFAIPQGLPVGFGEAEAVDR